MTADDPVASTLAEIRERAEAAADFPLAEFARFTAFDTKSVGGWIAASAMDVPRLLKALEAALKLTAEWKQFAASGDAQDECADELRAAITAALTAKEGER